MKETTAIAHPNFALIKYWGKKDSNQNRPAMSSISVTVDSMQSKTTIFKNSQSNRHQLFINGTEELDLSKILSWIESQKEFVPNKESLPTYSLKLKKAIQAFNNENHKRCVEASNPWENI